MYAIDQAIEQERRSEARAQQCAAALSQLKGIETEIKSANAYSFAQDGTVEVYLTPAREDEASALLHEVLRAVGQRKAEKEFSEGTGKVEYRIKAPGLLITIKAVPPRCEVEAYEVEDYIPARREVVKRFRLKNPAECLGQKAEE